MRGWQELGVVDTIYEDDQEEEEEEEEEEAEDESFSSSLVPSVIHSPSPPPPPRYFLASPLSLQSWVEKWTEATGSKADVVVRVHDQCFHLHRHPLVTNSGYLKRYLTENSDVTVSPPSSMTASTFEEVARFCYGGDVALTPSNLAPLRAAAEWLEMGADSGLVRRAEGYFFREVAADAGIAAEVLRSCAGLLGGPDAEAAAAAGVAAGCVEILAASGDGEEWLDDMAALSAEELGRIAAAMRARFADDHDLLYRVVDYYLHNHEGKLTEEETSRICCNINCAKLSHDILVHLVQNPRLPLRFVVQAMLIEQLHTRSCILDRATPSPAGPAPIKQHNHLWSTTTTICTSRSHGNGQLTLGAILQRDATRRQSAHIRTAMEATSLRIENLERDLAGLRQRLRWSEEKQPEMDSLKSASFRVVRPRGSELEEEPAVAEASCDRQPARSGGGLGRMLVCGFKNMFRKSDRVKESNGSSLGQSGGGMAGSGEYGRGEGRGEAGDEGGEGFVEGRAGRALGGEEDGGDGLDQIIGLLALRRTQIWELFHPLTFTPFEDPVCTADGSVFDIMNIVSYITKYGKHPVTGAPLKEEDLVPLTFHKNSDGEYHCPVLNKVFTEFTHIVAVKTTGNVFCYEAIKELNLKTKNWKELITDEPFTKDDLITIQNPNTLDSKVLSGFDHVKNSLKVDDEDLRRMKEDPTYNINLSGDVKQMLRELGTENGKIAALHGGGGEKARKERAAALAAILDSRSRIKEDSNSGANGDSNSIQAFSIVDAASASVHGRSAAAAKAASTDKTAARIALHMAGERKPVNAKLVKSRFTTGAASRSFTSTAYDPVTRNEFEYVKVEKNPKKKGYLQLHTTHGDLNLELHCDITPRSCENFITLCENGYYNGVPFHRNIRNFMIQGGDPTGTGKGGQSIWGKPFNDELNSKLLHSGRGVVSMANSGPHTNGSQFFILYKSANHLNFKHTVFGSVVGGLSTLAAMEKVPVDDDDRPLEEIKITSVTIFVNPYSEPDEEEEKQQEEKKAADDDHDKVGSWYSNPGTGVTGSAGASGGIGKYLKARTSAATDSAGRKGAESNDFTKKRKVDVSSVEFKNFSNW
ncbi:unnamed protein product [Musa hybrid cultivar]